VFFQNFILLTMFIPIYSIHFINDCIFIFTFFTIAWSNFWQINFIDCFTILIFTYPFIFFNLNLWLFLLNFWILKTLISFRWMLIFIFFISIKWFFPLFLLLNKLSCINLKYFGIYSNFNIIWTIFIVALTSFQVIN
jgi:hypothetical protein